MFRFSDEDDSPSSAASRKYLNRMTPTKQRVFEFMNNATEGELLLVNSITSKRAAAIIQIRPFENWFDLVSFFFFLHFNQIYF